MSKATNHRSVKHNLLELLIIPDLPPLACQHNGQRLNTVHMGVAVPKLYAVRRVSCGQGCAQSTPSLTDSEKVEVQTKLTIAAGLVRELQDFFEAKNYANTRPENNPRRAGPFTVKNEDIDIDSSDTESTTSTTSIETNGTSVVAGPSKRKASGSPNRVFKRQALPLVRGARDSEMSLILTTGERVRGFDKTDL